MHKLMALITWDIRLLFKYGIAYVALGISLLYMASILVFKLENVDKLMLTLVFTDPVMYGFLFTALMVLFEKDAHIHQVFSITPMPASYYLLSKAVVFTLLALFCSTLIMLVYQPQQIHWFLFVLAIVLTASLFVFIGILGALYSKNFNQFILTIPIIMAPAALPFSPFFDLYTMPLFYIFPTHACLILFKGAVSDVVVGEIIYGIVYLFACNVFAFRLAQKVFKNKFV